MEILVLDKNKIEPVQKYKSNLGKKEYIACFDVREYKDNPVFLVLMDNEDGFIFSEYKRKY